MKALVTAPFIPIVPRLASHRSAQGVIWADLIRQRGPYDQVNVNWAGKSFPDHNTHDELWVYHGSDFTGGLNLFGGMTQFPYAWNIRNFSQFKGKVYSLGIDFPAYDEMIADRIKVAQAAGKKVQQEWLDVDIANLKRMRTTSTTVQYPFVTPKLVIGDSHAICMHRPGWTVNSVPFTTLNGAINRGLATYIETVMPVSQVKSLECYFGNIDLRHHLCRLEGDPIIHARELANRYVNAVANLQIQDISIYELLPIENESRKLPSTGYYKGKPFWGTWAEREDVRTLFNSILKQECPKSGIKFIEWTEYLTNAKGELDFKFMEKPQSIHLSREFYPHWTGQEHFPVPTKPAHKLKETTPTSVALDEFFV